MLPFGVGVRPNTPWIKNVIRHEQTGLLVWPDKGVIYGAAGTPVGWECGDGYVRLGGRPGRSAFQYAHRLVWEAAHGPIPVGLEIDHLNGRKTDNRLSNLELVTRAENVRRAVALGLQPVGEQRRDSKLTVALVREIRRTAGQVTNTEWARRLEVDKSTIKAVRDGKTWRHVSLRGRAKSAPARRTSSRGRR